MGRNEFKYVLRQYIMKTKVFVITHYHHLEQPYTIGAAHSMNASISIAWQWQSRGNNYLKGFYLQDLIITKIKVNNIVNHPETFFSNPEIDTIYTKKSFKKCWRQATKYPYDHIKRLPGRELVRLSGCRRLINIFF